MPTRVLNSTRERKAGQQPTWIYFWGIISVGCHGILSYKKKALVNRPSLPKGLTPKYYLMEFAGMLWREKSQMISRLWPGSQSIAPGCFLDTERYLVSKPGPFFPPTVKLVLGLGGTCFSPGWPAQWLLEIAHWLICVHWLPLSPPYNDPLALNMNLYMKWIHTSVCQAISYFHVFRYRVITFCFGIWSHPHMWSNASAIKRISWSWVSSPVTAMDSVLQRLPHGHIPRRLRDKLLGLDLLQWLQPQHLGAA